MRIQKVRRYTAVGVQGLAPQFASSASAGTTVTVRLRKDDIRRYLLTDTALYDGSFVAEPVDHV